MLNRKSSGEGKRKRRIIPGFLLVLLFVFSMSFSAMADPVDTLLVIGSEDQAGNMLTLGTAFFVRGGGEDYVLADASVLDDNAAVYYLAEVGSDEVYVVQFTGEGFTGYDVVLFTVAEGNIDPSLCLEPVGVVKDEIVDLVYVDQNKNVVSAPIVMEEAGAGKSQGLTEISAAMLEGEPPVPLYFLAGVIDEQGDLAGIYTSTGDVISFSTDIDAFYGQSSEGGTEGSRETQPAQEKETGGTKSPSRETAGSEDNGGEKPKSYKMGYAIGSIISVVAVIGIICLVFRKKSKGKQQPPQPYQAAPPPAPMPQQPTPQQSPSGFPDYTPTAPYARPTPAAPLRPQAMGGSLMGIGGVMSGRAYPVGNQEMVIGRDVSCGIRFPADTKGISRNHCKVFRNGGSGQFMLMDCNSTYGTYLKGYGKLQPQKPVALKNGDTFYLGSDKNGFTIKY